MTRTEYANRPGRESLSRRLGRVAKQIRERDAHRCAYCGAVESGVPHHLDHLTPRSAGGADVATNLVVACRRCNSARGAMSLAEWSRYAAAKLGLTIDARAVRAQARRRLPC